MTLQKLSAGSEYEYLTRQVAALDSTEKGSIPLADYYSAKGESPGRWVGSRLTRIDGLESVDPVTAEQMKHLFGSGYDPVTGRPLGAAYKVFANETATAFNARVDEVLANSAKKTSAERAAARTTAAREFFFAEQGREPASAQELSTALKRYPRPRQTAVAGFDLPFSPVNSVTPRDAVERRLAAESILSFGVVLDRGSQYLLVGQRRVVGPEYALGLAAFRAHTRPPIPDVLCEGLRRGCHVPGIVRSTLDFQPLYSD